jgi:hypothetical protein
MGDSITMNTRQQSPDSAISVFSFRNGSAFSYFETLNDNEKRTWADPKGAAHGR